MTTKLKLSRFRIRKPDPVAPAPRVVQAKPQVQQIADNAFMPDPDDDGFAGQSFLPPEKPKQPKAPPPPPRMWRRSATKV